MKILLTSTSFQDTPGKHHDLLNAQGFDIDYLRGPVPESVLLPIIQEYDAVVCGDDEYTENVLRKGRSGKLKFISKYGVGLDRINLKIANELGIPVKNCPGVNQISVAEHVLALILTFEKNIIVQYTAVQSGSWKRYTGNEIEGKTIGIVGLGAIGKALSKKSVALGLKVIAFDLYRDTDFLKNNPDVHFADSLSQLFYDADYISLHLPHTPETEYIINDHVINNLLKKTPVIVNTARGMLVNTDALIIGLQNGKIRGYLTDVLAIEPIEKNEKLLGLENVIITPHVGSRTHQSVERQGIMAVQNLLSLING